MEVALKEVVATSSTTETKVGIVAYEGENDEEDSSSSCSSSTCSLPPFSQHAEPFRVTMMEEEERGVNGSSVQDNIMLQRNILGRQYSENDAKERIRYEESLFWMTYRHSFPEIKPYGYSSDAGWGCMLRASQMLLAQTLRLHYKSRDWVPPASFDERRRKGSFYNEILTWFADYPGKNYCFSFHNICCCGFLMNKVPGEWYGPTTASFVLRDICRLSERFQQKEKQMFHVFIAQEGCLYLDQVEKDMQKRSGKSAPIVEVGEEEETSSCHDPLLRPRRISKLPEWDRPLLLLIPLRLGLENFNEDYSTSLSETFTFPHSVGVLGGKRAHANWFYGATSDGSLLFGLDPHTNQPVVGRSQNRDFSLAFTNSYLRSMHTKKPAKVKIKSLDPSIALAFYCKNREDFQNLVQLFRMANSKMPSLPPLFSIIEAMPDYCSDIGMFNEMMDTGEAKEVEDEDDYVFL
mmetsp:Transcript_13980/g.18318  ORF Transcript_13980/g.18318 Transcript_13980/m.18318 type:complete len:463 (-) Transcript_13980:256-1644(-)